MLKSDRAGIVAVLVLAVGALVWLARLEGRAVTPVTLEERAESRASQVPVPPVQVERVNDSLDPPESAARTALGASRSTDPPGAVPGRILGLVVDSFGVPVPGALVRVQSTEQVVFADSSGRFDLRELEPDRYSLEVLDDGLPAGLLPAWSQGQPSPTQVEVSGNGGVVRTTLEVARTATLSGRVEGPRGEPVVGFVVRARNLGPARITVDGATDSHGRFWLERVWPGEFELGVRAPPESGLARLPRPIRRSSVASGQSLDLGVLVFEHGPCAVEGRVIDQDELPVEGIAIVCQGKVTGTDADGRFLLEGLSPKRHGVWIGPNGYSGYRRVFAENRWWVSVEADLSAGRALLDLGTLPIHRDPLAHVHGRVDAAASPYALDEMYLCVESDLAQPEFLQDPSLPDPQGLRIDQPRFDPESGAFELYCSPPGDGLRLDFIVRHGGAVLARVPVRAEPGASIELVIPVR